MQKKFYLYDLSQLTLFLPDKMKVYFALLI